MFLILKTLVPIQSCKRRRRKDDRGMKGMRSVRVQQRQIKRRVE